MNARKPLTVEDLELPKQCSDCKWSQTQCGITWCHNPNQIKVYRASYPSANPGRVLAENARDTWGYPWHRDLCCGHKGQYWQERPKEPIAKPSRLIPLLGWGTIIFIVCMVIFA